LEAAMEALGEDEADVEAAKVAWEASVEAKEV